MLLKGAFHILLSVTSCVSAPVDNEKHTDLENLFFGTGYRGHTCPWEQARIKSFNNL
jgi:hypothetical protein